MENEDELLAQVVKRLVEKLDVKAVILFGSRARGDWTPGSDYDLLIIADFRERYLDRIKMILDMLEDIPLAIEPHPYTPDEALSMLRKGNPIIVDALEEGKILYSTKELEEIIEEYRRLKERGLKRTDTTIVVPE